MHELMQEAGSKVDFTDLLGFYGSPFAQYPDGGTGTAVLTIVNLKLPWNFRGYSRYLKTSTYRLLVDARMPHRLESLAVSRCHTAVWHLIDASDSEVSCCTWH
jgi:hypothetical protein